MAKEPRNKVVRVRLTKNENDLAELLASNERVTVNELVRSYILKESQSLNAAKSFQFLKKTSKTLLQIEESIAKNSQLEEICNLLTQVKSELKEARTLIANRSNSQ